MTLAQLPWISGLCITAILAVPWYLIAEMKTPGFIDYFIVGEHFSRYFDTNWIGDKYGSPKSQPPGMIWVFFLIGTLPWGLLIIRKAKQLISMLRYNAWIQFLLLWMTWPLVFFTFSSSLLHTYVLPCTVPMALLVAYLWGDIRSKNQWTYGSLIFPGLVTIGLLVVLFVPNLLVISNTDKYIILEARKIQPRMNVHYLGAKSYSSQFLLAASTAPQRLAATKRDASESYP